MPELPEVETVKTILNQILKDQVIIKVEVLYARMVLNDCVFFIDNLKNHTIREVRRTGKYLLIDLDNDFTLISHLRMEGKYVLLNEEENISRHARIVFTLKGGKRICYDDSRMFGIMKLVPTKDLNQEPMIKKLGKEPFFLTGTELYQRIRQINRPIKMVLLDQSIISGLGNIYVDEVLFDIKINPLTPAAYLTKTQCDEIIKSSIKVLNQAIKFGGSTVKSYHASRDVSGMFQNELRAYGKADEPCSICNARFRKIFVGQRGTTFCPSCQRLVKAPLVIGITGKVASGKTTILKAFLDHGFEVISADEVIKELYLNEKVKQDVAKLARLTQGFDRVKVFTAMLEDKRVKIRIEKYLHPLVEAVFLNRIKTKKSGYIVLEVPLLFQAGFEYMCDKTIAIDITRKQQIENLKSRNCVNIDEVIRLNDLSNHEKYLQNADYIINNNRDLKHLIEMTNRGITVILDKNCKKI